MVKKGRNVVWSEEDPLLRLEHKEQCEEIPGEMLGRETKAERAGICRAVVSTVHVLTHLIHTNL